MIKETELSTDLITANSEKVHPCIPQVTKYTLEGIDEIQYLFVAPWTSIKMHGHDNQWEVWVRISHKQAYVCLKGEEHMLVNKSGAAIFLMAIKGHMDYSYDDLAKLFFKLGFSVQHGSLTVHEDQPILITENR